MSAFVQLGIQLEAVSCAECGMTFAMPEVTLRGLRRSHDTFYCPSGHRNYFGGKSDVEKHKEELEEVKRSLRWERDMRAGEQRRREAAERSAAARKGQITKLKKRAAAGVCPCCGRHFAELERHMSSKHPDYVAEDV